MKVALNNIPEASGKSLLGSSLRAGSGDRGFQDIMSLLAGTAANPAVLPAKAVGAGLDTGEPADTGLNSSQDCSKDTADTGDNKGNLIALFQPALVSVPPELIPVSDTAAFSVPGETESIKPVEAGPQSVNKQKPEAIQAEPQKQAASSTVPAKEAETQSRAKPAGQARAVEQTVPKETPAQEVKASTSPEEPQPVNPQEIQPVSNQDKKNFRLKEMWDNPKGAKESQTSAALTSQAPDVLTGKLKQQVKNTVLPELTTFYKQDASPVVETGTSFGTNTGQRDFNRQSMNSQEVTKEAQSLTKQNSEMNLSRETTGSSQPSDEVSSQNNIQQILNGMDTKSQLKVAVDNLPHLVLKEIQRLNRSNQVTNLQIKLEPEHLGELTVKLSLKGGELNAHFIAAGGHAKEIIENSLAQLRQILQQHNIQLSAASVSVGQESGQWAGGHSQQYSNQSNRQWRFSTGPKGLSGGYTGELKPEKVNSGQLAGVNYLI